jgi:methionine-rich copper-binding protein CopC
MYRIFFTTFLTSILVVAGCSGVSQPTPFIGAEPAAGNTESRLPRTLRLYFGQLPDVPRSSVTLTGPNGDLVLRGLHTMGANDLMMEIYDEVIDGQYTVQWQTYVGDDPTQYSGSYSFTVQSQ